MAKNEKLEVVASHYFKCPGAGGFDNPGDGRKGNVVVDVYKDGKHVISCTLYSDDGKCGAALSDRLCSYIKSSRK